jgi:hypothetical protein
MTQTNVKNWVKLFAPLWLKVWASLNQKNFNLFKFWNFKPNLISLNKKLNNLTKLQLINLPGKINKDKLIIYQFKKGMHSLLYLEIASYFYQLNQLQRYKNIRSLEMNENSGVKNMKIDATY